MERKSIDSIYTKLEDMIGWLKEINKKLGIQNGRVGQNEKDIALLKQRHEIEGKIESISRKKFLVIYSAITTVLLGIAGSIFLYILKRIIEG